MRSPNEFSRLGIESEISAIEACSHSMSIEAGSELGRLIVNSNSVVDKGKKEHEVMLSELREEEPKRDKSKAAN